MESGGTCCGASLRTRRLPLGRNERLKEEGKVAEAPIGATHNTQHTTLLSVAAQLNRAQRTTHTHTHRDSTEQPTHAHRTNLPTRRHVACAHVQAHTAKNSGGCCTVFPGCSTTPQDTHVVVSPCATGIPASPPDALGEAIPTRAPLRSVGSSHPPCVPRGSVRELLGSSSKHGSHVP